MIPDPPVREDGLCHVCKKPRHPERSRKYAGTVAELDPFCSVECSRQWHRQPDLDKLGRDRYVQEITPGYGHNGFVHGTVKSYRLCACELCTAAMRAARPARGTVA